MSEIINQEQTFSKAKDNVIKQLEDDYNKKIDEINLLNIEFDEEFIKERIGYSKAIDNKDKQRNTKIQELENEIKQIQKYIRYAKELEY